MASRILTVTSVEAEVLAGQLNVGRSGADGPVLELAAIAVVDDDLSAVGGLTSLEADLVVTARVDHGRVGSESREEGDESEHCVCGGI